MSRSGSVVQEAHMCFHHSQLIYHGSLIMKKCHSLHCSGYFS